MVPLADNLFWVASQFRVVRVGTVVQLQLPAGPVVAGAEGLALSSAVLAWQACSVFLGETTGAAGSLRAVIKPVAVEELALLGKMLRERRLALVGLGLR
jgi:hypothetical protein